MSNNEINLILEVEQKDINHKIYFLDNSNGPILWMQMLM